MLHDPKLLDRVRGGYRQRKNDVLQDGEVFPFTLQPDLQREIYDTCTAALSEARTRDLVNCFFTSYFNAWREYRNVGTARKRWVVAFEPGIARSLRRRRALGALYPDGKVVSVVRDPWSWYASARRWEPRWAGREQAVDHWCAVSVGTAKWYREAGWL